MPWLWILWCLLILAIAALMYWLLQRPSESQLPPRQGVLPWVGGKDTIVVVVDPAWDAELATMQATIANTMARSWFRATGTYPTLLWFGASPLGWWVSRPWSELELEVSTCRLMIVTDLQANYVDERVPTIVLSPWRWRSQVQGGIAGSLESLDQGKRLWGEVEAWYASHHQRIS